MSSFNDQTPINPEKVGTEIARILNPNSLHFISISLLFLPFTFVASATVQFYYSSYDITKFDPFNVILIKTIIANSQHIFTLKSLITVITFIFLVILPTVAGVALITYSTNQAIQRRHLTFSSAFKSLSHSYINILSTFISGSMILILLFFLITLSPIVIAKGVTVAFGLDTYLFSVFINQIASYVVVFTIGFFMVIWGSAPSIAVLESKSGYESLNQSAKQSKEFRKHSFSILWLTGFLILPSLYALAQNQSTTKWIYILKICTCTTYLLCSLTIVYYVVANTVLYVQCKAARGEDITETTMNGDDVSGEFYAKVAVNDKDDEVSRENANYGGFTYMLCLLSIVMVILTFFMLSKRVFK